MQHLKAKGCEFVSKIERFIISLGGRKIKEMKNIITPSSLFRFENDVYLNIEYDQRDQYKAVRLGRLFLIRDVFPRLIVLEDFEVFLQSANSIDLGANYLLPYHKLSYEQMIENVMCNLELVLTNYDKLYEISKPAFLLEEERLNKYLIKDVSTFNLKEIEQEASKNIYKPKVKDISELKLSEIELRQKEKSDAFRQKYNIPENVYTNFEYYKLKEKKDNYKLRFIGCFIIQFVALVIFILGLINNHLFVGNDVVYLGFIVVLIAAFGLNLVTSVKMPNLKIYELVLGYFVTFIFLDKIIKFENNPLLLFGTIIFGTIILSWIIIAAILIPIKKTKKATQEYNESFTAKYGLVKNSSLDYRDYFPLLLYLENGRYVSIITYANNQYAIAVKGSIFYKKIKTEEVVIDYLETEGTYEEAISKGLELLEKNNQLFVFKK